MQVTIHAAKTNLSKLIERVRNGEEIVIAKGKTPVARIVPIADGGFKIGILKEEALGNAPDFLEPMSDEDLDLWEGQS